jgi:hypothetical protein
MQGRNDEAWAVTAKLHGTSDEKTDSHAHSFAREEFYQMSQQVATDKRQAANESLWTLFSKPSYRKRMICAFLMMFASESTGILVVYSESSFAVGVSHSTTIANMSRLLGFTVSRPRI